MAENEIYFCHTNYIDHYDNVEIHVTVYELTIYA